MAKMSLSGEDSNGNKLNAEMEEELQELRTEKKILDAIKPLTEGINHIKLQLKGIDDKVVIHNNYEGRIRKLESNQYKNAALFFVIGLITSGLGLLAYKLIQKL